MRTFLVFQLVLGALMVAAGALIWGGAPAITQEIAAILLIGFGAVLVAMATASAAVEAQLQQIHAALLRPAPAAAPPQAIRPATPAPSPMQGVVFCPACMGPNPADATACRRCGATLPARPG